METKQARAILAFRLLLKSTALNLYTAASGHQWNYTLLFLYCVHKMAPIRLQLVGVNKTKKNEPEAFQGVSSVELQFFRF